MKKNILILILTISLAAGIIFTGYRSSAQKQKAVQTSMLNTKWVLNTTQKPEEAEEWESFRKESESKISYNETQIIELKVNIENNEELFDVPYKKKVAILGEQIRFIKARLENYEKSPSNWESFRSGIKQEMDTLEKALVELTDDNKKE